MELNFISLRFVVLALATLAVTSCFKLEELEEPDPTKFVPTPFPVLFQRRHVREASRTQRDADRCEGYLNCVMTNYKNEIVRRIVQHFEFGWGVTQLRDICPVQDYSHCHVGSCTDHFDMIHRRMASRESEFICDHQSNFTSGAACWEQPFASEMMNCVYISNIQSPFSPMVAYLLNCFAEVPKRLDACTDDDVTLVAAFTENVIKVGREFYSGGFL